MGFSAPSSTSLEQALQRERSARKKAEQLLEDRSRELYNSKQALEASYASTVEVFASLICGKSQRTAHDLRDMAREARRLARRLELSDAQIRIVYMATLLCDLGKLALPDPLVDQPVAALKGNDVAQFRTHPTLAHNALIALKPLEPVANVILAHCELYNGNGYPNRLSDAEMPVEAKILGVVKDFDALKRGLLLNEALDEHDALEYLKKHRELRYDPHIVDVYVEMILQQHIDTAHVEQEERLLAHELEPGMVLTRDFTNERGALILPAEHRLDEAIIGKLRAMRYTRSNKAFLFVVRQYEKDDTHLLPSTESA